jgi:peptide-methionine (R)-S-oxide reductase
MPTPKSPYFSPNNNTKLQISPEEYQKNLSPELYAIARQADTERPHTGLYNNFDQKGKYFCAVCGRYLFASTAKFASSCGWPSFFQSEKNAVVYKRDSSYGMERTEVCCANCDSHLGHIFTDGPQPTGNRYCMNSTSLHFEADKTSK